MITEEVGERVKGIETEERVRGRKYGKITERKRGRVSGRNHGKG
jgi:hypothetical protein